MVWHIFGAYFLQIWGVGPRGGQNCLHRVADPGALKGTEFLGDRPGPKRRFSQKTAYFRRFTPSPGNSSIWRAQKTAENRRFSQ